MVNEEYRIQYFHQSYDKCEHTGCWIWKKSKQNSGYGQMMFRGKMTGAHRVSYMIHKGEMPDGLHILHSCDNRECVNPDHLRAGTNQENIIEMVKKGRQNRWRDGKGLRTLEYHQVVEIKLSHESDGDLAKRYGVSRANISSIRRGKSWKHVLPGATRNPREYAKERHVKDDGPMPAFFYQIRHYYLCGDIPLV